MNSVSGPLNRLYRIYDDYHLYANNNDADAAVELYGFILKGPIGLIATSPGAQNFKPVYRLYKPAAPDDHLFTLSETEASNAVNELGYRYEGIKYYCTTTAGECGASVPFHKFWTGTKHFYTVDFDEGNNDIVAAGGTYDGVLCYIWPTQ